MARILVVDDNDQLRELLRFDLESRGHELFEAADSIDGLLMYRRHNPDIVICDIFMPGISGTALIRELKRTAPEVKTIVITGNGRLEPEDIEFISRASEFDRILSKPFRLAELRGVIADLLKAEGGPKAWARKQPLRKVESGKCSSSTIPIGRRPSPLRNPPSSPPEIHPGGTRGDELWRYRGSALK